MDEIKAEKRKRARKKRLIRNITFSFLAIMLGLMTVICIVLLFSYQKQKNISKEALTQKEELEQQLENGSYISKYESDKQTEEAASKSREELLGEIRSKMEEGTTLLTLLEELFPEKIVAGDRGKYFFFDVNEKMEKNPYTFDVFNYPVLNEETNHYEGEVSLKEETDATARKGVDVSKFQGEVDWNKVKNDGVDYAYMRLGYRGYESGKIVMDETYEDNVTGCNEAGIETGVYFFTEATSEREAREEAEYVLENIEGYRIDLPIVIDVEESASEDSRTKDLTREERTEIVKAFCDRIEESGHKSMIYGNLKSFMVMMDVEELEDYDKWFAYYKYPLRFPYKVKMWQYTCRGDINGLKGGADINIEFY